MSFDNCRSINLTLVYCKLMELLVRQKYLNTLMLITYSLSVMHSMALGLVVLYTFLQLLLAKAKLVECTNE